MSDLSFAKSSDVNDPESTVSATINLQGGKQQSVSVVGTAATARELVELVAKAFNVTVNFDQVAIVANGSQVDADATLTGQENLVAVTPQHSNG